MVVAGRETVSVLGNNWVNLCCRNLRAIDGMWMRSSNGKYGLTPQLEIGQKVGGSLTAAGFQAVAHLSPSIPCAVTAIYSASQAVVSAFARTKYAIAYVNRATRLSGDGFALVQDMADVLKKTNTEILAASIKSPSEAVKTLLAGAHHLTLPFDVLQAMTVHELSQQTVDEFAKNGRGI